MNPPRKILIINIFGIGDVLFTTPLIANLKAAQPGVVIGYLCNRRTLPLLKDNPKIDHFFVYERDELEALRRQSFVGYVRALRELTRAIRAARFDAVLDLSLNTFMGFITFAAGIRRRIGPDYKGRGFFLTEKIPFQGYEDRHVVDHYLDLLSCLGVPVTTKHLEYVLPPADAAWADAFLKGNGSIDEKIRIGMVPGGGDSWGKDAFYKRWPPERFAKLADNLIEKFDAEIILMGGQNEAALCSQVARLMQKPCLFACGKTSISQFASLTRKCALVIANDGGPLHVSVAAGAKTVSIFGPVDERVYGPYPYEGHKVVINNVACRPCYRGFRRADCEHISCLNGITIEDVLERVKEVL